MTIENIENNKNVTENLTVSIGKDEYGKDIIIDLSIIRHLLVAGATGSGKSTLLHRIVSALISNNSPQKLKLILIDPKRVELPLYNGIPHLLTPVIVDQKKTVLVLRWAVKEILRRYDPFERNNCRNIDDNEGNQIMPRIVIVIDEFSDSMQTYPKETEEAVVKIVQIGYAVGVHIILSTSRPSTKVYTKKILDEITTHIALQTGSTQDSKLVMGTEDAYKLRGAGDILIRDGKKYTIRGQIDMLTQEEVQSFVKSVRNKYKDSVADVVNVDKPEEEYGDDMYEGAREAVIHSGMASTSFIQRKLGIGYSRAAHLMDMLEEKGVIGPANGSKPREVIMAEK